jgi:hypothetical protein
LKIPFAITGARFMTTSYHYAFGRTVFIGVPPQVNNQFAPDQNNNLQGAKTGEPAFRLLTD